MTHKHTLKVTVVAGLLPIIGIAYPGSAADSSDYECGMVADNYSVDYYTPQCTFTGQVCTYLVADADMFYNPASPMLACFYIGLVDDVSVTKYTGSCIQAYDKNMIDLIWFCVNVEATDLGDAWSTRLNETKQCPNVASIDHNGVSRGMGDGQRWNGTHSMLWYASRRQECTLET
jgi:hypothetical protein